MSVIERFDIINFHDSQIKRLSLDFGTGDKKDSLVMEMDGAGIPKESEELDYEIYYEPARLEFIDVKRISFPEQYYLECYIMQYAVRPAEIEGYISFSFMLSGGWNTEVWARPMEIVARDFVLGGNRVDYQKAIREGRPGMP